MNLKKNLKIAYEMAFFLFGYDYIEHSDTAKKIRDSIMGLMKEPLVRGQIPCESDDMEKLFTEPDKHFIFITGKGMYIRLFNISGFVNYEETNSKFMLEQEKYELFTIDYVNKRWNRERFIDRLAKTMRFV